MIVLSNGYTAGMLTSRRLSPSLDIPSSGAPLYRQVKRNLLQALEAGEHRAGQCLPSEKVLAAQIGVSIGTLRKAVDELVHEHVLIRRQGKGTYVAQHSNERFMFQFFHVQPRDATELDARDYPQVETLRFERARAQEHEALSLRLRTGEPIIRIVNRLRLRGRPILLDHLCISNALFKGMTEKRFVERPSTIYQLYQSEYGISVLRTHERLRAVAVRGEDAIALGLKTGQPVLEVHRSALSFGDKPVEYRVSTINTALHDYVNLLA
jgi:GntR family transcriptional regulator